ncbi:helix-turn-helix domain-containing protein [Streptomyces sp. NPDC046862]|uniref:helix-turn-helix domain-containing protein n=1 Tax=Streptomyces sp. NPDC046862 TaxID=3154603 RepID=UPI0034542D10
MGRVTAPGPRPRPSAGCRWDNLGDGADQSSSRRVPPGPHCRRGPRRHVWERSRAASRRRNQGRPELTLAQICRLTGPRHATAHRLVGELADWGALERVSGGAYVIGLHL